MLKTIDYEFPRGDTFFLKKFRAKDSAGNIIQLKEDDEIYFTMKTDSNNNNLLLQKKLNEGIVLGADGYFHITIEPADTNNLEYGSYVYDIQMNLKEPKPYVKTLINGTITLTDEVTWAVNER